MEKKSTTLIERFGPVPDKSGLKKEMRMHQGWWRTNVLSEEPGLHPNISTENVCNTILCGENNEKNFLTPNAIKAVREALANRTNENSGIIKLDRLFNNLLSSQPLSFNFFGELYADHDFGLKILKLFYKDLTKLNNVFFEYAPNENYIKDNSAFDVAFEVEMGCKIGILGFECKYTDTFSYKLTNSEIYYGDKGNKNHDNYLDIYNKSKVNFTKPYYDFVQSKDFNQLFRNQLIAETLLQNKKYDFVQTGLFCYELDKSAIKIANDFKKMLSNPESFKIITYRDFICEVQRLNLDWNQREWTMLLWARYCALALSKETTSQV